MSSPIQVSSQMTAEMVISAAYRKNGVLEPSALQTNYAMSDLINMLASWSADGLIVPFSVFENFTLTAGQAIYTIGEEGTEDFDTARPIRILNAYIKENNIDYGIEVDMTRTEYAEISLKETETFPSRLYYDPQFPSAKIKFNAEPDTTYAFYLISEKPLALPTTLTTTLYFPLEFNRAMVYNLAIEVAISEDNKLPSDVAKIAEESLRAVKTSNMNERLDVDIDLTELTIGFHGNRSVMNITRGY